MRFRKFLKPYKTRGSSFREHTETIVGSVNTHKDVHMKNIRNTRKKEQKRCHQDYMKEGRNYGLHISVRKPGRNSARFFGTL